MYDRAGEVVDHQLQNRLDLLLSVTGIVCKCSVLFKLETNNIYGARL